MKQFHLCNCKNLTKLIIMDYLQKQGFDLTNKILLILDITLALICGISCILTNQQCLYLLLGFFTFLYSCQSIQHYLLIQFPKIDINKHHSLYKILIIMICIFDMGYMLMGFSFWQKSESHPIYCYFVLKKGYGLWIGFVMIPHVLLLIGWGITLINGYVTRRYYLLALGGFEVQQRILAQRGMQLRDVILQPDINPHITNNKDKFYKFQDVQDAPTTSSCPICINGNVGNDKFVDAGCGHYFHKICLIQWGQVNSTCPLCRYKFNQIKDKEQQLQNVQNQQVVSSSSS